MSSFTRYLATIAIGVGEYTIQISDSSPVDLAKSAIQDSFELRYSPILPAFLVPGQDPPSTPVLIESVTLLFSNFPYQTLGSLRPHLLPEELGGVYFTLGLASLVLVNFNAERVAQLANVIGEIPIEHWPVKNGKVTAESIATKLPLRKNSAKTPTIQLPSSPHPELKVYTEQIAASLQALWASYGIYFPEERETLLQIAIQTQSLIQLFSDVHKAIAAASGDLLIQKKSNAITAALVEISAALSYAVTQGTSGSLPVLSNRSPFPHHSLLGIGGAIRGLTKYTRYVEYAFGRRSAAAVISTQYATLEYKVPASIPGYSSGPEYKFANITGATEYFDDNGDFPQQDQIPLIAHFSLRHGFMESKFSVTAASEALTAESLPQWTLMTLSHELMHSRVRTIFQALFGKTWEDRSDKVISKDDFEEFSAWIDARQSTSKMTVKSSLRNLILLFCNAIESVQNPINRADVRPGKDLPMDKLVERYSRHKHFAAEILVHFHDYYFVYAGQPKMYLMSIWASWIKVAGPFARPLEYLTRSLATVACGTGLPPKAAFDQAKEYLLDALDALKAGGIDSPLFGELRRLLLESETETRAYFYPCYYLVDNVQLFFASRKIVGNIDRIDQDPFAQGSASPETYSSSIYVFGEGQPISPIRYSIASLFRTLKREQPISDAQWLSAWNYMVISSQETKI